MDMINTSQKVIRRLLALKKHNTWYGVAKSLGVNRGIIFDVMHGKRHPTPQLFKALGMPVEHYAPAMVCPKHGVVHQGRCPRPRKSPVELQAARDERERRRIAEYVMRYNG